MSATAQPGYRLGYRSDIEGLRAVAILLVVAAHAGVPGFAGGFVGVDMFFVLSGYLITGLLVQEIERSGAVNFAAFYARRFRRLLPGLLVMLAVTALVADLIMAPPDQPEQASAAAAAALWLSNFYFAFANLDYFGPWSDTNPFLHTWSLGVEEQFYVVWPVLVVLVTGAWAGTRAAPATRRIRPIMAVVLVASLAACAAWAAADPLLSFYMMPARAWQFALGALAFAYFGSPAHAGDAAARSTRSSTWLRRAGWLGLATAVLAAVRLGPSAGYPWPWALLPSLGTAAILAAGAAAPQSGAGALLSLRPLQAIGRVSYSWYLWHWPVLLIGAVVVNTQTLAPRVALALLSLLLAAVAYRFIEKPLRRLRVVATFPRLAVASALALLVLGGLGGVLWHDNALARLRQPEQQRYLSLMYDAPIIYGMGCDDEYRSATVTPCEFGPADAPHTAVIIGDSVAMQWFPAVAAVFSAPEWHLVALTKSACPMVDAPLFYPRIRREYTECAHWRSDALRKVAAMKPELVILGSTYSYDLDADAWTGGTKRVLASISPATRHVYVLRATPRLPFNPRSCLATRVRMMQAFSAGIDCSASAEVPEAQAVFGWISHAAGAFANVSVIDLNATVCPEGVCLAERDGLIVYRDFEHMTTAFVRSIAGNLRKALEDAGAPISPVATQDRAATAPAMPKSTP